MVRARSSLIHKIFVALLAMAALFIGTAWLTSFQFSLAVLQTMGVVDKARMHGLDWSWDLTLKNDSDRHTYVFLNASKNRGLSIGTFSWISAKQAAAKPQDIGFGPVVFSTRTNQLPPSRPMIDIQNGSPLPRFGLSGAHLDIAHWFLWPLLAAYPIWWFVRGPLTTRFRRKHGLCLNCGYSLQQLTEPRCPECGSEMDNSARETS